MKKLAAELKEREELDDEIEDLRAKVKSVSISMYYDFFKTYYTLSPMPSVTPLFQAVTL